jgi:hypothetical protein
MKAIVFSAAENVEGHAVKRACIDRAAIRRQIQGGLDESAVVLKAQEPCIRLAGRPCATPPSAKTGNFVTPTSLNCAEMRNEGNRGNPTRTLPAGLGDAHGKACGKIWHQWQRSGKDL